MIMHIMTMTTIMKEDAAAAMTTIIMTTTITIMAMTMNTIMKEDAAAAMTTIITTTTITIIAMSIFMWIRMIPLKNTVMIQPIPKDVGLGNMIMRWDNEESLS